MKTMERYFILICFAFFGCGDKGPSSGDYYFPMKDLLTERTDHFFNTNDSSDHVYWKMRSYVTGKDTFFRTMIYDLKHGLTDSTIEKVSNGNSDMIAYTLIDYDEENKPIRTTCEVVSSAIFKRDMQLNERIEWKLGFIDFRSGKKSILSKTRELISLDAKQQIFHDHLKFEVPETMGGYEYDAKMVYEKGKGLVSYNLTLPGGQKKEYIQGFKL
jgi:hypothetical protein